MIKLLDCTLRDGGYVNDWRFGYQAISDMIKNLENTNVDILEVGFLKDEPYQEDRTVFNDMGQITNLIPNKRKDIDYAAMIEVFSPVPIEELMPCTEKTVDIIRVIVWKTRHDDNNNVVDALADGYDYCKGVVEKGYKLCVQPARVEQYSDEEFISMVKLFETLNPMAIYIVDSWGTCQTEDIIHYMKLANDNMKSEIAIGYHGHNNMMQAFGTATALLHQKFNRDLIVDGSVYGMGRCAGNLNLEIFARYLNETENKNYELSPIYSIYEKYIKKIYEQHKWGYNIYYFLTAVYKCHPNYAFYLGLEKNIDLTEFEKVLTELSPEDKILYTRDKADFYYNLHAKGIT